MCLAQLRPHHTASHLSAHALQVFNRVCALPQHKVAIGSPSIQAITAYQRPLLIFLKNREQFLFPLLAQLRREQSPLSIKFVESETYQLARLLRLRSIKSRLLELCGNRLFCHDFSSSLLIASTRPTISTSCASICTSRPNSRAVCEVIEPIHAILGRALPFTSLIIESATPVSHCLSQCIKFRTVEELVNVSISS